MLMRGALAVPWKAANIGPPWVQPSMNTEPPTLATLYCAPVTVMVCVLPMPPTRK